MQYDPRIKDLSIHEAYAHAIWPAYSGLQGPAWLKALAWARLWRAWAFLYTELSLGIRLRLGSGLAQA
jgi:hypothetical protein